MQRASVAATRAASISPTMAVALVLIGISSVQFGAGIAKALFDLATPTVIVWMRLAISAAIMVLIARPALRGRSASDWRVVLGFGLALAAMNWSIYQSFARIPIGIAVTIEFVGPLGIALVGSRRARDLVWVGLAGVGVVLLGAERANLDLLGVVYALIAGVAWAAYILLSANTGRRWSGLDGLAVASAVAALGLTPFLLATDAAPMASLQILASGALIALLSSVIPYSLEMTALRSLPIATFGILMSLEPAAAALAGLLVVGENLGVVQWAAIGCVAAASAGATRAAAARLPAPN